MDLISLAQNWFPALRGLHVAVGHSGTSVADTLDSVDRGSLFAAYTSGAFFLFPHLSGKGSMDPCGYALILHVWDQTNVNSGGGRQHAQDAVGFCLQVGHP